MAAAAIASGEARGTRRASSRAARAALVPDRRQTPSADRAGGRRRPPRADRGRRRRSSRSTRSTRRAGSRTVRRPARASRWKATSRPAPTAIAIGAGRRARRRGPARDGDGGRVREGPQAVRHARSAPTRPSRTAAPRCCSRSRARAPPPTTPPGRATPSPSAPARGLDGQGLRLRRRLARDRLRAPGARRHRLHLGARPALPPQARQGRRPPVRRRALHRERVADLAGV